MSTCPGCVGRGTGTRCCMCDQPISPTLQRTSGEAYPQDRPLPGCGDCAAGRAHSHR